MWEPACHVASTGHVDRYERRRRREERGSKRGEPGAAVIVYKVGNGSWWDRFQGYDPDLDQAAAKEQAAGEGGAAAGPAGND